MAYIWTALIFLVIGGLFFATWRRTRLAAAAVRDARSEVVCYRVDVRAKVWLESVDGWSTKTLALLHLIVRTSTVEVSTTPRFVGMLVGSQWVLVARNCRMYWAEMAGFREPWLILEGPSLDGRNAKLALRPAGDPGAAWTALSSVGVYSYP